MKKWGLLDLIIGLLSMLLVLVVVAVIIFITFPQAGKTFVEQMRASLGITVGYDFQDLVVDTTLGVKDRATEGYEFRIKPFFINGYQVVLSPFTEDEEEHGVRTRLESEKKCLDCHRGKIINRTALSHLYIDHRLHIEKGIDCKSCHPGTNMPSRDKFVEISELEMEFESEAGEQTHTNFIKDTSIVRPISDSGLDLAGIPGIVQVKNRQLVHLKDVVTISEGDCIRCHKKGQDAPINCRGCHPPGSVGADGVYADTRKKAFFGSDHIVIPLPAGFEHGKSTTCVQCHEGKRYCLKCHADKAKHPDNWVDIHGTRLGIKYYHLGDKNPYGDDKRLSVNLCNACHWQLWCSQTCHKNEGTVRKNPGLTVPLRKIEHYLNF